MSSPPGPDDEKKRPGLLALMTVSGLTGASGVIGLVADLANFVDFGHDALILAVSLVALILAGAAAARLFRVADRVVSARVGAALVVAVVAVLASGVIGFGARGQFDGRKPDQASSGGPPVTSPRTSEPPLPTAGPHVPPTSPAAGPTSPAGVPTSPAGGQTGAVLRRPVRDVTLTDGTELDLDSTAPDFGANNCGSGCDIHFRGPLNGIEESQATMAEGEATYDSCLGSVGTGFRFHPTTIEKGQQACALTDERRRAGLVVKDFKATDRDHVTKIVLTVTVWEG